MPLAISENQKKFLLKFLSKNEKQDLMSTYLLFLQNNFDIDPVLSQSDKVIYINKDSALKSLEESGNLYKVVHVKIPKEKCLVNEDTLKVYICPFSGKVFGNNTHPNPQDAIYNWVATCPENNEFDNGMKIKRFYVSDDPDVIKSYIKPQEQSTCTLFSLLLNGKLFLNKGNLIEDYKKRYLVRMTLSKVQNQNRFKISGELGDFIQEHFQEEKISEFVNVLASDEEFFSLIQHWFEYEEKS